MDLMDYKFKFKYQFLNQICFLNLNRKIIFKWKISNLDNFLNNWNNNFQIWIKFFKVQILIFRFIIWTIYICMHIIYINLVHTLKYTPMSLYSTLMMQLIWWLLRLVGHINLLMDENNYKINLTNMMKSLIVAS